MREDLYYAISRSTHHEGKIELGTLLEKPIGKRLETAAMLALEQDVSQLLAALPSLELYLPVDEHRRAWFGGDPIRVAVGVHEEDGILRAFSADGTSELLDTDTPPSDPILVVTKSETDFSQISFPDDRGIPARTSSMITGSEIVFGDSCATYQVADTIPGLYMFCNEIYDDHDLHEPFYRGDPEIEVHFFHEADSVYADFSSYCVGPSSASSLLTTETESFHQTDNFWKGEVRLIPTSASNGEQFLATVYEDDGMGPCQVETTTFSVPPPDAPPTDSSGLPLEEIQVDSSIVRFEHNLDLGNSPWAVGVAAAYNTVVLRSIPDSSYQFQAQTIYNLLENWSRGLDEDDFVGLMIHASANGVSGLGWGNFAIVDASDNVIGRSRIFDRYPDWAPRRPPLRVAITGPSEIHGDSGDCTWRAVTISGSPPYSYQWKKDGVAVSTTESLYTSVEGSDFVIEITVTDDDSDTYSDSLSVAVSSSYESC